MSTRFNLGVRLRTALVVIAVVGLLSMLLIVKYLTPAGQVSAATADIKTITSGNWSDPSIWTGGSVPGSGQLVEIAAGHNVTFDTNAVINGLNIDGTLDFSRTRSTTLETRDNIIVRSGGELTVGLPEDPQPPNITTKIIFDVDTNSDFAGGPTFEATDTGLWALEGSRWESHGAPILVPWTDLAKDAPAGSSEVVAEGDLSDWPVGAKVLITATGRDINHESTVNRTDYFTEDEERTVVSTTDLGDGTTRVRLNAPVSYEHSGSGSAKGEIALLSRNVIVTSKGSARAHTMYMQGASGSLSHTLFSKLGPKSIEGRYPVHFHTMAETSIGKLIRGNVVWDSMNRFFVIHNSLGIELSDNIGYRTLETAYWLETTQSGVLGPKPHDNVLIHNLAVKISDDSDTSYRLAAFYAQRENHFIGNTAVSVAGKKESSGFHWPEADIQSAGHAFVSNESHSNLVHGLFGWQNSGNYHVVDFTSWRNGHSGVKWGAYQNDVQFHDLESFGNVSANFHTRNKRPFIQDSHFYGEADHPTANGLFIDFYSLPPSPDNPGRTMRTVFEGHSGHDISHTSKETCGSSEDDCIPTFNAIVGSQLLSENNIRFGTDWETTDTFFDVRDWSGTATGLPENFRITRPDQPKPSSSAFYYAPFDAWIDPANTTAASRPLPPTIQWTSTPASIDSEPVRFSAEASGFSEGLGEIEFFVDEFEQAAPWRASYFDNATLSGSPVVEADKRDLDFAYREAENLSKSLRSANDLPPYLTLTPSGEWSARYSRTMVLDTGGTFEFWYTSNDGIRIYIDGERVLNKWATKSTCCSHDGMFRADLDPGSHDVVVEFFVDSHDRARLFVEMYRVLSGDSLADSFTFDAEQWKNRRQIHVYARAFDRATGYYAYAPVLKYDNPNYELNAASPVPAPEPTRTPAATATPPGTPPPADTPTPTATPVPGSWAVMVSQSENRTGAVTLDGAVVAGNIYAFFMPETGATGVSFYLDDPHMSGPAHQSERRSPFDFNGGSVATATAFDTTGLADGSHTITARAKLSSGSIVTASATFTVSNSAPTPTTHPSPSPTSTPSATPSPTAPEEVISFAYSLRSDRSNPVSLEGRTVSGVVYPFLDPDSTVKHASFFLDDPAAGGNSLRFERNAPFDVGGGSVTVAQPFDTKELADGEHTLTSVYEKYDGSFVSVTVEFTVDNSGGG